MTDAIVPNPTWLKGLQSLDVAELSTARQILIPKPSIWSLGGASYTPTRTGWAPVGIDGGTMSIDQDEGGHLFGQSGIFAYVTPESGYYRYDFQCNFDPVAATAEPALGLGLGNISAPFSGPFTGVPFVVYSPNPAVTQWSIAVSGEFFSAAGAGYIPVFFQATTSAINVSTGNFSMREIVT